MSERNSGGALSFLSRVFDIMFLSVLWLLFCLPIITIGPSTTALYYTTAKVIRKDRGYIWQEFIHAFKTNLINGIIYTALLAAIIAIFYFGLGVTDGTEDTTMKMVRYAYIFFVFLVACGYSFLFPILSRFDLPRFQMLKMSFLVSLKHLPTTIVLVLLMFGGVTLMFYMIPAVLFAPAIISLLSSLLIERVFKKYLPKPEEGASEDDLKWYQTF